MTKAEKTRQFIIEKSAPIFNTRGVAATAMSDIMDATKLSKGSLYVHFDNKDVLARAAVDHNMDIVARKVTAALAQHTTTKDKLFAYIDVFSDPMQSPAFGGCPIMNFGLEADDTNTAIRGKANEAIEINQQLIADLIKSGIKEGTFNPDWNYKEFATMMFAMIEGGVMFGRIAGNNNKMKIINRNLKQMISQQVR
jgi:AcrR family transcriptional regulator